jgi:tetratricopeptide (TPR) repeat protein
MLDAAQSLATDNSTTVAIALQQADIYILQKRWAEAEQLLWRTQQAAQGSKQKTLMVYTLCQLGLLAQAQGDWAKARYFYERALNVSRVAGTDSAEARAKGHLADTYLHEGNASYAVHLLDEALPTLHLDGDMEFVSYFSGRLGEALIQMGQEARGLQLLKRALRLAEQLGQRRYERQWALALGERALVAGHHREAYIHYKQALALFNTGAFHRPQHVMALCQMSRTCLYLRLVEEGLQYAQQAYELGADVDEMRVQVRAALGMALRAN